VSVLDRAAMASPSVAHCMQEVKRIQRYFSGVGIFTARAADAVGGGIPAHIQCVPRCPGIP
jgi:hypothetical protein